MQTKSWEELENNILNLQLNFEIFQPRENFSHWALRMAVVWNENASSCKGERDSEFEGLRKIK